MLALGGAAVNELWLGTRRGRCKHLLLLLRVLLLHHHVLLLLLLKGHLRLLQELRLLKLRALTLQERPLWQQRNRQKSSGFATVAARWRTAL